MQRDGLILFRSLTYAQRGKLAMERAGVTATIRKAPQGVSDRGCTYGVKLRLDRLRPALAALERAGVPRGKVFAYLPDGSLQEVRT